MAKQTRQRQERDFPLPDQNTKNTEKTFEASASLFAGLSSELPKTDEDRKESIFKQMEFFKETNQHETTPVDGHEPPELGLN